VHTIQFCCFETHFSIILPYKQEQETRLTLQEHDDDDLPYKPRSPKRFLYSNFLRVLRRIFVPKRDEVTVEWRRMHQEELNDLYSSRNILRVIKSRKVGGACSTYGGE
jgi:hypothetical protein